MKQLLFVGENKENKLDAPPDLLLLPRVHVLPEMKTASFVFNFITSICRNYAVVNKTNSAHLEHSTLLLTKFDQGVP